MADILAVRDEYRAQQWAKLIQGCKANGIEPYEYLLLILTLLSRLFAMVRVMTVS